MTAQKMIKKFNEILKWILQSSFFSSFRHLSLASLLIPVLDIAKVLGIALIYFIVSSNLNNNLTAIGLTDELKQDIAKNIGNYDYAPAIKEKIGDAQKFQFGFQVVLLKLAMNIAIAIIGAALIIALANTFIWKIVAKNRFKLTFILKYFSLLLIWNIPWILLFLVITYKFKPYLITYAIPIELFIFLYFSLLLYPIFAKEQKIFRSIGSAFRLGALKFHRIIGNTLIIYLIYIFIFTLFLRPLFFSIYYFYYVMLIATAAVAWLRYFIFEVVKNAEN